ncbi:MAG: AI-2E family transporter [Gemmatimonadales bacterium]
MAVIDTNRQRAALLIMLLGVGIALALAPYASGLIGAAVLYVLFAPLNALIARRLRPSIAAGVVTTIAVLVVVFPGVSAATMLVNQAQHIAGDLIRSPFLQRLAAFDIGGFAIGPRLATTGEQVVSWLGGNALSFIGTATRVALNVTIAFFGLYFLCLDPDRTWEAARVFIPFSQNNTDKLKRRFRDVTNSTVIGIFLIAVVQGVMIGLAFWALGIGDAVFWGVVTGIISILPVIGSVIIWAPAAAGLILADRVGAAIALIVWGAILVASADNVIRPVVYRRYAQIHPMITLVGAVAGLKYFGMLGILIGPLALSYFFELIRMYRDEYLDQPQAPARP